MGNKIKNKNKRNNKKKVVVLGSTAATLLSLGGICIGVGVYLSQKNLTNMKDINNTPEVNFPGLNIDNPQFVSKPPESLQTEQPIIKPNGLPKTDLTDYLLSQTTTMKDKAEVAYKAIVIKDYINNHLSNTIGSKVNNVELIPVGDFTPVRYNIKLHLDQPTSNLSGFNPDSSDPKVLLSTTYYPSTVLSDNVSDNQFKGYTQQGLFYKKELRTHSRTLNDKYYVTELNKQYDQYGFKYPG